MASDKKIVSKPQHGARISGPEGRASRDLQVHLDDVTLKLNDNVLGTAVRIPTYVVAEVPAAADLADSAGESYLIFVSDESGGAQPAFWDGTNWRRFTDRAVVS